jgi:putative transposase
LDTSPAKGDARDFLGTPGPKREQDQEALQAQLYQQIGQLKGELDWLKKKAGWVS